MAEKVANSILLFFRRWEWGEDENTKNYRTAVATLRAKGAWKLVDAKTSKTD
jgi:hypothetical protein